MFDIGWAELALVFVVALIVIGPKDLPVALRAAGVWMGRLRRMAREFQSSVDEVLRESELKELRDRAEKASRFDMGEGLPEADRIHLVDHWVTPLGERRRFDTRFFVAAAPDDQEPLHDDKETIASRWVRPAEALDLWRAGELQMFPPTVASLEFLVPHVDVAAAMTSAAAVGIPPVITPRIVVDGAGRVVGIRRPGDRDYDTTPEPEFVIGVPR